MASQVEAVLLASGAQTTTQTLDPAAIATAKPLLQNSAPSALEVIVDTSAAATGSVTPSIEEFDIASGTWATRLAGTAITGTGRVRLVVGLGVTPAANLAAVGIPPKRWRVVMTANNANSQTYSVSAKVLAD